MVDNGWSTRWYLDGSYVGNEAWYAGGWSGSMGISCENVSDCLGRLTLKLKLLGYSSDLDLYGAGM